MISSLLHLIDASPVNFLAVAYLEEQLLAEGFTKVDPSLPFPALHAGDCFFVTKNNSSLYAFRIGSKKPSESGFKLIAAHCDSPTFRIKPKAAMRSEGGIIRLNTEVYGGAILSTWFDRPLSLAGRVIVRGNHPLKPVTRLLHIKRPLLQIPNIAIHFNRQVNDGVKIDRQKDVLPFLGIVGKELEANNVLINLIASELNIESSGIIDFDLYLYETTPACLWGLNNEFISAGRLDDLSMVHAGLEALLHSHINDSTQVLAIFDNEETGSGTKQGAASSFLRDMLERVAFNIGEDAEHFSCAIEKSFMVSADNAHAHHPNYNEKFDPTNHPVMGGGPVIKYNAAQKYISDAESAAIFAEVCKAAQVPCQKFVNNSNIAGGSTLGNILTSHLPLRGVDIGNPMWAMHSVRETGNVNDHLYCIKAMQTFFDL